MNISEVFGLRAEGIALKPAIGKLLSVFRGAIDLPGMVEAGVARFLNGDRLTIFGDIDWLPEQPQAPAALIQTSGCPGGTGAAHRISEMVVWAC